MPERLRCGRSMNDVKKYECRFEKWVVQFPVPGSSRVKDAALADTIPPGPPVLRSLFNLVQGLSRISHQGV